LGLKKSPVDPLPTVAATRRWPGIKIARIKLCVKTLDAGNINFNNLDMKVFSRYNPGMVKDEFDSMREQWERERPDLDPSDAELLWRISFIHKQLKKIARKRLGKYDVPVWAFDVLAALRRVGPPFQATPTELCAATLLTSGAMTNRLDRLEESDLVERSPDPNDRRGTLVRLTPKGKDLVDQAIEVRFDQATDAVSSLSRAERRQLAALLRKLVVEHTSD
jgi:DNA-binding MarR family transcriptional regulator